jgi:hypothetical protein
MIFGQGHAVSGFGDWLVIHKHLASHDESLRLGARAAQAQRHQRLIQPKFTTSQFMSGWMFRCLR